MKKIGFVDYFIDEWHANNYPAWIEEASAKLGVDYKLSFAWAKIDEPHGVLTTDAWCEKISAIHSKSVKELCENSDNIVILAPSNPEEHLDLVKLTFPHARGKRLYIDKTFAPDLKTAREIFRLAKEYDIEFFSTSALRYAFEESRVEGYDGIITEGGGGNFEEYIIHQTEMVVKVMGCDAVSVSTEAEDDGCRVKVVFRDGRTAEMKYKCGLTFSATLCHGNEGTALPIDTDFFKKLMEDMLRFFESGRMSFDPEETLAVAGIREAAIISKNNGGETVALSRLNR